MLFHVPFFFLLKIKSNWPQMEQDVGYHDNKCRTRFPLDCGTGIAGLMSSPLGGGVGEASAPKRLCL